MHMNRLGFSFMPLFAPDGMGGGGVDGGGGEPTGDPGQGGALNQAPAEPSIIDMDEEKLIRIKGQDKPVKFGDHVKGFQAQHTKAAQRAAQLERELQTERQQRQEFERRAQDVQRQQARGQQSDVYEALRQLPYLTGEDAVGVVQQIAGQIGQRDQILAGALHELRQLKQLVGGLHETHTTSQFEGKIQKFLSDGGYGPEYGDIAKELYVAYEGADLDQEFPQILRNRVAQLEKAFEAKRRMTLDSARKVPFVPGKGSTAGPSKPLEIKPNASAKEVAEQLWGSWHTPGT